MDPVQAAKNIIDSLVEEELKTVNEAYNEDEEENEDEEGEEETDEGGEEEQPQRGNNQASVAMKPAQFSASNGGLTKDAHGGGVKDAHGGGEMLGTMQYMDNSAQNRATVGMKPSFATGGSVAMSEEKVREDIMSIFGGSEDLTEEFISKAGSIYEAAVMSKVQDVATEIHEQYETAFAQEVEEVKTLLTEKIDQYLNYVVDEWMNDNKLAIENGIRTEIAESFISKLKNLFVESYIEVPQNKTNLFDEMAETIETLESRVNEEIQKNVNLVNENNAVRAVNIFSEETKFLTDVQVDKVSKLVENLEYINENDFTDKVKTIVENVTKQQNVVESKSAKNENQVNNKYLVEETVIEEETSGADEIADPNIRLYSDIISRTLQK